MFVCNKCHMVGMEDFTVADHLPECTIFNKDSSSTHEIKKVCATKDIYIFECSICERRFGKFFFLKLHLTKKHGIFDVNFKYWIYLTLSWISLQTYYKNKTTNFI